MPAGAVSSQFDLIRGRQKTLLLTATASEKEAPTPSLLAAVLMLFSPSSSPRGHILPCAAKNKKLMNAKVCESALLWALASRDMSFALRMCQHVDDEGVVLDHNVRDAVFRVVGSAIKQLPDTAVVNVGAGVGAGAAGVAPPAGVAAASAAAAVGAGAGGSEDAVGGGEWKVEGTNATVEQLWDLDALLQGCVCVCSVGLVRVDLAKRLASIRQLCSMSKEENQRPWVST